MKIKQFLNRLGSSLGLATSLVLILSEGTAMAASSIRVVDQTIRSGVTSDVTIQMDAGGNENAVGFSLQFDPARLTFEGVSLGGGVSGAQLIVNSNQAASGRVGVLVGVSPGQTFPSGSMSLVRVSFRGGPTAGNVSLSFVDGPVFREVSDAAARSVAASFSGGTVTVSVKPVANPQTVVTDEDVPKPITLTGSQTGGAGALTFAVVANPTKGTISGAPPNVTYTPNLNANGSDSFTFKANDGSADSDPVAVTVTINPVNDAPVIPTIAPQSISEGSLFSFGISASDPDVPANGLSYALEPGAPAGMSIGPVSGALTWTPSEAQGPGSFQITVRVTDNGTPSLSSTRAFNISVGEVNSEPVLSSISNQAVAEGSTLTVTVTATDPDIPSNTITFSLGGGAPAGMSINPSTGFISWTPTEAQGPGSYTVTVQASDNGSPSLTSLQSFSVTVGEFNLPPSLSPIASQSVDEGATVSLTVSATDPDLPATLLTFSLEPGAPSGASINQTTGAFTWTTTEAQGPGSYPITVAVSDGSLKATQTFTVVVNEVNEPPLMPGIGNQTVNEGQLLLLIAAAADRDEPKNKLTFSLSGAPAGASIDPNTGVFTWIPTEDQGPSTSQITIQVSDGGTPNLTVSQTFTVVVNEVNSPPSLSPISGATVNEGSPLALTVSGTDSDLPAGVLTYGLGFDAPSGMSINPTSGAISWTPTEQQGPGSFTFTVQVSDSGTPALTASGSVTVVVTEVNQPPVLGPIGGQNVRAGSPVSVTAQATDPDFPPNPLTYSLGPGAPEGATINPTSGAFNWTPTAAQGGRTFTIPVVVSDGGNPVLTATQTFDVVVNPSNTAPVFAPVSAQNVAEGNQLVVTLSATDADVPPNQLTYGPGTDFPAGATLNPSSGVLTWTPTEADGPKTVTIAAVVTDNGIPPLSATISLTVNVTEVNQPPVLAPIGNQTVVTGSTLSLSASATDADLPANALTFSLGAGAPAGASINPSTGAFSWTPSQGQGPATIQVTIQVADNGTPPLTASQTFTVVVAAINTPPVLAPIGPQSVNEGSLFGFTVGATDADLPPNTLTYSLEAGAPSGMSINPTSGLITWTPSEIQGPSTSQITVKVTDNGVPPLSATRSFSLVVQEVNSPPTLAAISPQAGNVDSTISVRASATDSDRPANRLTFSLAGGAPAGASIDSATGAFTWKPTTAQGGANSQITIQVTDDGTPPLSDSKIFTVAVSATPAQPPTITAITAQSTRESTATAAIVFTVNDPDTVGANLNVTATSSNPALVPAENIRFGGTGNSRTVSVTPALDQTGSASITVTVEDNTGLKASTSFDLTVTPTRPTIARDPQDIEVPVGSDATFSVAAGGSKPLTFQWFFNDAKIEGATNPLLTVSNAQTKDEGNYRVEVSNRVGPATSKAAKLTVNDRLRITVQPISQTVLAGVDVTLLVAAGGKPPLSYQWLFNGSSLSGKNGPSLTIPLVSAKDTGDYSVVVTNLTGSVTSDTAKLLVNSPVTIAKEPTGLTVAPGASATFSVEALGTPPLQYQWQLDGRDLSGQTGPTLSLSGVTLLDAGNYVVVVSNEGGKTLSKAAALNVQIPPTILLDPKDVNGLAEGNAAFEVTVSGTEPLKYQWLFNGTPIPSGTERRLVVAFLTAANEGSYSVFVTNVAGVATSKSAALKVSQPVLVTGHPKPATVNVGGSVSFSVTATGTLPLTYQWRYKGIDLPGKTQPTLTLADVKREDAGDYRVEIKNASGPVLSDPATLTVNDPVTFLTQPKSQSVTNGASVVFSAEAVGTAPLSYQWRFNGANIGGQTGPSLTLSPVKPTDAGKYSVVVSNPVGPKPSADADLTVINPPRIETPPASQRVAPGANVTFSVTVSGDAPLSYQWQLNGGNIPGATNPTLSLSNVQPVNSGNYRVVVQNPGGAVTSDPAALDLILPPLNLGNVPGATTPVETPEGVFDGGDISFTGLAAVRKSTQPTGGSSRWFSWKAPTSGIVTFNTIGSNFDTFLAVYTGPAGNLKLVSSDDDRGGSFNSQVTFNAIAGTTYQINVQGFGGAAGKIVVAFKLNTTTLQLPEITTQPQSQTVTAGSDVNLTVQAQGTALTFQWYVDGVAIAGATSSSLVVKNLQEQNTGKYTVRVTSGTLTVESDPAVLQIGTLNARSVDKFRNSPTLDSGVQLAGRNSSPVKDSGGSVARGYSGAQVFSTVGSAKEQGEPNHAGEIGGASQWFTYQSPADGVLRISTEGSNFDTVLALYTGPGTDFASLKMEAFDNNSGSDGKSSVIVMKVKARTAYFVAVDGVKGATGTVKLTYEFGAGPEFALQPQSQNVAEGGSAAFFVQTKSALSGVTTNVPAQSYQWWKDGRPLPGENRPSLTVVNAQSVNVGDYFAIVSNFAGASTSSVARLSINVLPKVSAAPISQSVKVGDSATFSVSANGTEPLSYQWRVNGVDIANATQPTLNLNSIQLLDIGLYTVVVRNPGGFVESPPAALTIEEAAVIREQPVGATVNAGGTVTLSVTAGGTAPFTYQWRFKGVTLTNNATQQTLILTNLPPSASGDYTVIVANNAGAVISQPAIVIVRAPLSLSSLPQNRTVTAGSTTVFSVGANGTGPFAYQWRLNSTNLAGATNFNLTLANVQIANAGPYSVIVGAGTNLLESPPATLTVASPPQITAQPESLRGVLGSTAIFNVTATGTPPLTYQWSFNGTNLPAATNTTLTVTNVQPEKVGSYSVKVNGAAGSVSSGLAALTLGELVSDAILIDGVFQFELNVPDGKTATVQMSTDMEEWTDLLPAPAKAGTTIVQDTQASAFLYRFYRVILK